MVFKIIVKNLYSVNIGFVFSAKLYPIFLVCWTLSWTITVWFLKIVVSNSAPFIFTLFSVQENDINATTISANTFSWMNTPILNQTHTAPVIHTLKYCQNSTFFQYTRFKLSLAKNDVKWLSTESIFARNNILVCCSMRHLIWNRYNPSVVELG